MGGGGGGGGGGLDEIFGNKFSIAEGEEVIMTIMTCVGFPSLLLVDLADYGCISSIGSLYFFDCYHSRPMRSTSYRYQNRLLA